MDIAQLGFEVDSSGLVKGEQALDRTADAADKAGAAAIKLEGNLDSLQRTAQASSGGVSAAMAEQENRLRAVAQRGVEFADSMRGANQSERSLAEATRESTSAFDSRAAVMATMGTEQERLTSRAAALQQAEARLKKEVTDAAKATQLQELNMTKLLGKIDPTIAKLNQLADLEGSLEKALDVGAISPELFDQYQGKIDATRAATLNAGKASDIMTKSLGGLNLQSVETQQSVAALVRSLVSGQWGQAQASMTSLTARTGAMGGAFSAAGVLVGGATAAVGAFTIMAAKGYIESRRMEGVIIGMGGAAGVTTGQMFNLRNEVGSATRDYAGATAAINQLLLSGKLTGDMLESVVRSAAGLAQLTGQSVTSVASEIESLATGGEDALIRLNDKYGFLTLATYRQIEAIREERGDVAALTAAFSELEREQASRTRDMVENAGWLERAYNNVKTSVLGALQAMKDVGRQDAEYRLQQAVGQLSNVRMQVGGQDAESVLGYRMAREEVQRTLLAVMELDAKEQERSRRRQQDADGIAAESDAAKAMREAAEQHDRRLGQMDKQVAKQREINEVMSIFNRLADEDPRHFDGSREKMLADIEKRYTEVEKKAKVAKERLTEEDRAALRLQQQYEQSEASMVRQIALHGQVGRAAAIAYDTAHGALKNLNATQKATLLESAQWLDWLDEMANLDDVWSGIQAEHQKSADANRNQADQMSEYAKQAARNMQSHFADYLFDPFAEGTEGMAKAFSDTIRRMLAEAAAAKFFEMIGGAMAGYGGQGTWGNIIRGVGGAIQGNGEREYGGYVSKSGMYKTGERNKPELLSTPNGQYLIPGDSGRVDPIRSAPAGRGGAMGTPQININLIGAPEGSTATAKQNSSGGFDLEVIIKQIEGRMASNVAQGTGSLYTAQKARFGLRDTV